MARRKSYNFYDDDFKATAVALTEIPGVHSKHVAEALDIHIVMLYRWRMEMRRGEIMTKKKSIQIDPGIATELKHLRKLEREYSILKQENELLKKAIRHSLEQKKKSLNS
jgi:transposase